MQIVNEGPRRILVIDDNDAIHSDFKKILVGAAPSSSHFAGAKARLFGSTPAPETAKTKFELDSAMQGQEGLAKLEAAAREGRPYSVAFVDMRMPPGWDGLQTIQKLWEVDADIQVVICSAYSDYSWEDISAKLGLTDRLLILKKPFDPAEVTQLAAALSEKWALRRATRIKMEELEQMVQERTKALTQLALHDKLTGLPNRTQLSDHLAQAVQRAHEDSTYKYGLLFLDFDRFKMINDSLGHEAGDSLLQGIAERLTAALTIAGPAVGNALAARLGGDEFVILIDHIADARYAGEFADGLLRTLNSPYRVASHDVHSTASIGITTSDLQYTRAEDALRDADTAMYHAKAAGKARYAVFDRRMHEAATKRLEIENDLRGALDRRELLLHYQPIVCLATGQIDGFEALVRWNHPKRGMVSPLDFIPCAEEIGLIIPAGYWILGEACRQLRAWTAKYPHLPDLKMSVNLSGVQLADPDLVNQIQRIVQASGIDPSSLALEITESVMIKDTVAASGVLRAIRALGIRLHMDDFGTGYSALNCLHRFPLNGLKIDRSFIQSMSEHRGYAAVVNAIVSLARNLGIMLIAEGIETAAQLSMLQAFDCDLAQGYFFDRPRDVAGAEAFVEKQLVEVAMA